jgi:hypothetical protein
VRASHACASGQYSCSRNPLRIPACIREASKGGMRTEPSWDAGTGRTALPQSTQHVAFPVEQREFSYTATE